MAQFLYSLLIFTFISRRYPNCGHEHLEAISAGPVEPQTDAKPASDIRRRCLPATLRSAKEIIARVDQRITQTRDSVYDDLEGLVNFVAQPCYRELPIETKKQLAAKIRQALIDMRLRIQCPECGKPSLFYIETPGSSVSGMTQFHHDRTVTHTLKQQHRFCRLMLVSAPERKTRKLPKRP